MIAEGFLSKARETTTRHSFETAEKITRPFGPLLHAIASIALKNMTIESPGDIDYSQYRFRSGNGDEPAKIEVNISDEEIYANLASGAAVDEALDMNDTAQN